MRLNEPEDPIPGPRGFNEYAPKTLADQAPYDRRGLVYSPPVLEFCKKLRKKYVVEGKPFLAVRETGEDGDNPHYHFAFYSTSKIQSVRTFVNRAGWKGNESYSLKIGFEDLIESHFDYLCKGASKDDLPHVFAASNDFDYAVIDERHKRYWCNFEEIKATRKRKADSASRAPIGEQIYALCKQEIHGGSLPSEDKVIEIAMRWYITNKASMSVYHVTNVVNWVVGKLHSTSEDANDLGKNLFDSNRMEIFKQNCKLKLSNY